MFKSYLLGFIGMLTVIIGGTICVIAVIQFQNGVAFTVGALVAFSAVT